MKRSAGILAVLSCLALLSSCGSNAGGGDTSPAAVTETSAEVQGTGWSYGQVNIGGGGVVTGIISTSEPGLFYARTDVGGAYRWDKEKSAWKPLSLDISKEDVGLLGIDGIACDPSNAANLYMIAGTSYFSGGKTCVLVSHDYGEHFDRVDVSDLVKVHGNGMGRGNGERIAVDPSDPDRILIGGRTGGMILSEDGGKTFSPVDFPVTSTANENGINIILFDPNDPETVYAGVSRSKEDNVFVSHDGGNTWEPHPLLNDDIRKYMPCRFDIDSKGRLYISCGNNEGPWNSMTGQLFRLDGAAGTAEGISPDKCTIGDIVIDPSDDNRIVLVSSEVWEQQPNGGYGDIFFRSTDGGESWQEITPDKYTMSVGECPWIEGSAIHWCSCLAMDSGDPDKILVNSGNGIFACDDIWGEKPEIYFDAKGIEETVPLDLISYEDFPLVSAIGDYDGYVHEDIFSPAVRHTAQVGSVSSISVAFKNRDVWAKAGTDQNKLTLLVSGDRGQSWDSITASPEEGKVLYGGSVALTADGSSLIWSPENSMKVYRSEDMGNSWEPCTGIVGSGGCYVIGDNVDENIVYASSKGVFYVSRDKGRSFRRAYDTSGKYKRLAVSPTESGKVYIPAGGMGLLMTSDAGENISLVKGLKYCEAVGLGKPKNEGSPYVIYVWGTPADGGAEGIYMSEDDGASWSRVNDDLHAFGGTGNGEFIVGDMNVYGRVYMSTVGLGIAYCDKDEK